MLRIISGLLLLIISQISFASTSTTTETIAATKSIISAVSSSVTGYYVSGFYGLYDYYGLTKSEACSKAGGYIFNTNYCVINSSSKSISSGPFPSYSCSSGFLSDSSGIASSSGHYCTNLSCISGYTLSGTNCTKENTVDSCTSYAGQSGYFWVSKVSPPSTICSGTCLASAVVVAGFPDADPLSFQYLQYTYTGVTESCTSDSGFTDESSAAAANAAAAERERLAKIDAAIADAKSGCGGEGHYTSGTFNGDTVIACKDEPTQTTVNNTAVSTTTTANPDGSTTTTTTTTTNNNTSITNNNSSTTIGSNGGSSTSPATTGGSSTSTTKTETVTTNPDGSTTTEVTETTSGAGNTAGVFESPAEGTDYLKDVFGSESLKQLVDQQTAVKEQITLLQSNIKGLFSFSSIAAGGSMESNNQTIMGASVDLSGKSIIDLFTQGNIASAFWILAVLIGITVVLTKRN